MLKAFIRLRRQQDSEEVHDNAENIESAHVHPHTRGRDGASIAQAALNDVRLTRERARSGELQLLDSVITWENVLCLMRNIVCHEEDTQWSALGALAQHAIQFFGSRAAVADLLCSYYRVVVVASTCHSIRAAADNKIVSNVKTNSILFRTTSGPHRTADRQLQYES